jgi:hypothetical protein
MDHPHFGVLKVTPWRIDLVSFPAESFEKGTLVWHNRAMSAVETPAIRNAVLRERGDQMMHARFSPLIPAP